MFERFASLTRFSHDWTITEKIDGTNACIFITTPDNPDIDIDLRTAAGDGVVVFCQSRNRIITPTDDNMGFATWVSNNIEPLVEILGQGRHYGEWCGGSIQRGYGLKNKKFVLFNTHRWRGLSDHPDGGLLNGQLTCVPVLAEGYMDNPGQEALHAMDVLKTTGSAFAPGFMDPEGVVMRHNPSGTVFKKTFDYDEQGKWAENQERKKTKVE